MYSRRELAIRGRRGLALLRSLTLALVLLLLWNPALPGDLGRAPESTPAWVLVDASPSMAAVELAGDTLRELARDRVATLEGPGVHIVTFGGDAPGPHPDSLAGAAPLSSRLAPALDRALEAGAPRITVLTDLRLADPAAVRARLARSPVPIAFEVLGGDPAPNAGIGRLEIPSGAGAGDSLAIEVGVSAAGITSPVEVEVLLEGVTVRTEGVTPPSAGREATVRFVLPPADSAGFLRLAVRIVGEGDAFAADDMRERLLEVDPESGGLVLLSFAADWEPRFLLPVLERVTGLSPHGFVALAEGRWLGLSSGAAGGGIVQDDEVRRRAAGAELLVLHGTGAAMPPWVREAAADARRVVVFPDAPEGVLEGSVTVGTPRAGEWYPATEPAPSVLAASLAGVAWAGLPPLTSVMPLEARSGGDVPLEVQLGGSGPVEAALMLSTRGGRRTVTVLARGFWRWAFRPGAARDAYRRLWSGAGGWLLADEPISGGPLVRPRESEGPRIVDGWSGDYALPVADLSSATGRDTGTRVARGAGGGRPLRTHPLPYLLALVLLSAEWVLRRRRGLR